ncbi:hypothetical protein L2735_08135 [Shewanella olleyana]|uniref:hypothetical protein n=1 Tax=Shewanella olleyana TaxID=135626 RepID=UPI00200C0198|nr:hypothetical protein [Shewanella olleyana]MCL1066775.1 hypothetical protein [Shewanella olleyana]
MHSHKITIDNTSLYFIGDVYGRLDKLNDLLVEIDFDIDDPESSIQFVKLVFCGNLIAANTGENIEHIALLTLVKNMVDKGFAYCLLGSNEFEVIGWSKHHPITDKPYLPETVTENLNDLNQQRPLFLQEFAQGDEQLFKWVDWFMALPIYLDFDHIRAIHACWDNNVINELNPYLSIKEHEGHVSDKNAASASQGHSHQNVNLIAANSLSQQFWPAAFDATHPLSSLMTSCLNYPDFELTETHPHQKLSIPVVIGHYPQDSFPDIQNEHLVCVNYNAGTEDYPLVSFAWHQGRKKSIEVDSAENAKLSLGEFCFIDQPSADEHIAYGVESLFEGLVKLLPEPTIDQSSFEQLTSTVIHCVCFDWDPLELNQTMHSRHPYASLIEPITLLALSQDSRQLSAYLAVIARYQLETESDNLENRCLKIAFKLTRLAKTYLD